MSLTSRVHHVYFFWFDFVLGLQFECIVGLHGASQRLLSHVCGVQFVSEFVFVAYVHFCLVLQCVCMRFT